MASGLGLPAAAVTARASPARLIPSIAYSRGRCSDGYCSASAPRTAQPPTCDLGILCSTAPRPRSPTLRGGRTRSLRSRSTPILAALVSVLSASSPRRPPPRPPHARRVALGASHALCPVGLEEEDVAQPPVRWRRCAVRCAVEDEGRCIFNDMEGEGLGPWPKVRCRGAGARS